MPTKVKTPPTGQEVQSMALCLEALIKSNASSFLNLNLHPEHKAIVLRYLGQPDTMLFQYPGSAQVNPEAQVFGIPLRNMEKYAEIERELDRAKMKHPSYPTNLFAQSSIMLEEAGEVAKAVNDYMWGGAPIMDIKLELVQTAAMCARMIETLQVTDFNKAQCR